MDDHVRPSMRLNSRYVFKGRGRIEETNNHVLRALWVKKNVAIKTIKNRLICVRTSIMFFVNSTRFQEGYMGPCLDATMI